jgi:transitional endoplasmic reticulum ATPase
MTKLPEEAEVELAKLVEGVLNQRENKSQQQLDEEAAMLALAELGGRLTAESDIVFQGTKVILPANMNVQTAIEFLEVKVEEDEQEMQFSRVFNYRPWDGARATMSALKKAFGLVAQKGTPNWWGGTDPPELMTINIGPNETDQVPWGGLAIPLMPGATLYLDSKRSAEYGRLFQITASAPRKYRFQMQGIFKLVEDELRTNSLYRGKAFDGKEDPDFLDLAGVDPSKVIYSQAVLSQLDANLCALIRHTKAMKAHQIPLKRAVLFAGPYGTGKTLGAYLTALIAQQHGWTFVLCRPGRDNLKDVMATARLYQPSVVFFEDVDVIADTEEGGASGKDHVGELLDIFDGIQSKGTEILVVLTTNHVERIHKGMMRPGRLDAVIEIGALDTSGVERMAKAVLPPHLLADDIDWDSVSLAMTDFLPAFVREALDRSIRYNLARNNGVPDILSTSDLVDAAVGLRPQLDLMNDAKETKPAEALGVAFRDAAREAATEAARDMINSAVFLSPGTEDPDHAHYRLLVRDKD